MNKKRIVIFGYSGSIHVQKWALSLKTRGHDVRVISLDGDPIEGVQVVMLPRENKISYFKHAKSAAKIAMDFNPDIVHVHYAGGYGIWGVKTKFHPLILSVWGSDIEKLPKSIFYRPFIKQVIQKADMITATSEALKQSTLKLNPHVEDKISIVPFGVAIPETYSEISEAQRFKAIYLKHLLPVYGPDILIRAVSKVIIKYPKFYLTMCGEGVLRIELEKLTKKLQLDNNIFFAGFIHNEKVGSLIQEHGFMVMPSLKEGFGVAAVESFANGRPVVASNVGGVPEIVTDNKNGYLVKPDNTDDLADGMIRMIDDFDKMKMMGTDGYNVTKEKYDWEVCVDKMIALYEKL